MSGKSRTVKRGVVVDDVNLAGCVLSRPRMVSGRGKPQCWFLFGDHVNIKRTKVVPIAVARELVRSSLANGWTAYAVAVTGLLQS